MALFFAALAAGYSGAMMPGPLLTYDIERSLQRGWKAGLFVPLGHAILEILVVALLAAGLKSFLHLPLPKIIILFVGGIVLLWFGGDMIVNAIKNKVHLAIDRNAAVKRGDNLEIMWKSGIISILNPYFLLWWVTVGLGFLTKYDNLGIGGVLIFYAGHATADFSWYFAVSLLCDRISRYIGGKAYRIIIAALGALLVFFAVDFIVDGTSQFIILIS
jgi:threonine/homoserine/homoserine lactone efflux protein